MGQGGRALALAGVTLATMFAIAKISGASSTADLGALQRKPVDYNTMLGQLRWWCYHGYKWNISHDFEVAARESCQQLLSLADLQGAPLTGSPLPAPAPAPAPATPEESSTTPPAGSPYPCDATPNYREVGIGDCQATRDSSGRNTFLGGALQGQTAGTYQECAQLCDEHSEYFSIVSGTYQCCGYNFHTITSECILYTTNPNSLATEETTTTCCASTIHFG
jgi:hypothetical protein